MSKKKITQPLKWHGGKHYLAKKIIQIMPHHKHYVEPFLGGGAVILEKDPDGVSEVVNDLNRDLTNFWRVLQCDDLFQDFMRIVSVIPFSEAEFESAGGVGTFDDAANIVLNAVSFFVRARQSRAGNLKSFATLSKKRLRRRMNEQTSAWMGAVDGLPAVHERLMQVAITNRHAAKIIRSEDGPGTLFYCDPPYVHSTRAAKGNYQHEMTDNDHVALLDLLSNIKGKFMLSGYPSELYDKAEKLFSNTMTWRHVDFDKPNQVAGGETKPRMIERVWMNF